MKNEIIKELLDEILASAIADDKKMQELDESINPASHSRTVHLTKTLIDYINEKEKKS
jgi:hypothetical protein